MDEFQFFMTAYLGVCILSLILLGLAMIFDNITGEKLGGEVNGSIISNDESPEQDEVVDQG